MKERRRMKGMEERGWRREDGGNEVERGRSKGDGGKGMEERGRSKGGGQVGRVLAVCPSWSRDLRSGHVTSAVVT